METTNRDLIILNEHDILHEITLLNVYVEIMFKQQFIFPYDQIRQELANIRIIRCV